MPRRDNRVRPEKEKKYIDSTDLKREIVNALFNALPFHRIGKFVDTLREDPDAEEKLKDYLIKEIEKRMMRILDIIGSGIYHSKYDVTFIDTTGEEIVYDVDILEENAEEKTGEFLKKCFKTDDLAELFYNVLIDYITSSKEGVPEEYISLEEAEIMEKRVKEWEKEYGYDEDEEDIEDIEELGEEEDFEEVEYLEDEELEYESEGDYEEVEDLDYIEEEEETEGDDDEDED